MTDDEVNDNLPAVDGFDDAEDRTEGQGQQSDRVVQGDRLKFTNDSIWVTGDDEEFAKDRELVVVDTGRVIQKWRDQNAPPVESTPVGPGQKWPDVKMLNEAVPRSEWREGPNGELQGPYQRARVVYLVDLKTMEKFTWVTATVGGDICVREFRDKVAMMRKFRGARVYAVVTLTDKFMPTRWGGRQRPEFRIVRWIMLGPDGAPPALQQGAEAKLEPVRKSAASSQSGVHIVEEPSLGEMMNDEVKW
jgi:hypothetical protein